MSKMAQSALSISMFLFVLVCTNQANAVSRKVVINDADYVFLRDDLEKFRLKQGLDSNDKSDKTIYVANCGDISGVAGNNSGIDYSKSLTSTEKKAESLSNLAYRIAVLKSDLKLWKYPENIWASYLSEFENKQLQNIDNGEEYAFDGASINPELKKTVLTLNAYRKAHAELHLPFLDPIAPGCGADETSLVIKTSEKPRRIQVINAIYSDICRRHGVDPFDSVNCPYVEDYGPKSPDVAGDGGIYTSGIDIIKVTWKDGSVTDPLPANVDELAKHTDVARFDIEK